MSVSKFLRVVVVIGIAVGLTLAVSRSLRDAPPVLSPEPVKSDDTRLQAAAALRAGIITTDTRIRCRSKHKRKDVIDACVHPPNLPPFNPSEAVAYSCNYFFATTAERVDGNNFAQLLDDFGFGHATGIDNEPESAGVRTRLGSSSTRATNLRRVCEQA